MMETLSVHKYVDRHTGRIHDARSKEGTYHRLKSHVETMQKGPLFRQGRASRKETCNSMVGFVQKKGTCWLNSICNALFFSDLGSKLVRSLYVDWVVGVRAGEDVRRNSVLDYFARMADVSSLKAADQKDGRIVKLEVVLNKLNRYSNKGLRSIGPNNGYLSSTYIKKLYVFLGVPLEKMCFVPKTIACVRKAQVVDAVLSRISTRKTSPLVVFVQVSSRLSEDAPRSFEDEQGNRYVLDSSIVRITNKKKTGGHAIAGVTCGGSRLIVDSNIKRDKAPATRSNTTRIVPFDWDVADTDPVRTLTLPDVNITPKNVSLLVYYNSGLLNCHYNVSKFIADEYLGRGIKAPEVSWETRNAWKKMYKECGKVDI
jgi:hypothetical protein